MSAQDGAGGPEPEDAAEASTGHLGDGEARRRRLVAVLGVDPADEPAVTGGDGSSAGLRARLSRLCDASVAELGVSGAGITVMGSTAAGLAGHRDQLAATGGLTRRLEDLQLTAGEGPCLDAYGTGAPVLAGDLATDPTRWLGFGPEAIAAGAAAVFSLPLQVGAVRLGTLDLHRDTAGALGRDQLADALVLASLATETLLELVGDPDPPDPHPPDPDPLGPDPRDPVTRDGVRAGTAGLLSETVGWLPDVHAEVHQASGMVAAREGIGVGEALLRIRGHAFAHGEPIDQVARRVLDRDLVLRDHDHHDPEDGPTGPEAEGDQ